MPTRDNGLVADHYVVLTELDPRLADSMLATLRGHGIAAWAEPSPGRPGPYAAMQLPSRPLDRLWVDGARLARARELVLRHAVPGPEWGSPARPSGPSEPGPPGKPGPPGQPGTPGAPVSAADGDPAHAASTGRDTGDGPDEQAWARIVAAFDAPPSDPVPPWPVSEDYDAGEAGGGRGGPRAAKGRGRGVTVSGGPPAPGARDWSPADPDDFESGYDDAYDEDEGHYVPPPPPPLPRPRTVTKQAIAAIVVGIFLIFAPRVWSDEVPSQASFVGVAAVIGGFVTLVVKMRDGPPHDSGPDDGAVL